jgi:monoterpene epsilon-lactone hydrolase
MAALALDLPGVRYVPMARETPRWRRALIDTREALAKTIYAPIIAHELARASRLADPAARHAELRARFRAAHARHISLMEAATAGLKVERAFPSGPALSHIAGDGWHGDGVLLYVPGGSFVVERSPHLTALIARIARAAQVNAVVCDYRLAPEHPCPAAVDDVETAFEVLTTRGHAPHRIVLVGESTGGGIALAAAQRLVARGCVPGGLALLSPWIDCDPDRRDLDPATRQCAWLYLHGADPRDPACNPMHASMRGLPPVAVHANRGDVMFADAHAFAARASAAGVRIDLRCWPGRVHVLERHDDPDARRSIAETAAFISRRLAPVREVA